MPVYELTGQSLFDTFVSGGSEVIENQQDLNRINVFPVPDGDTGSNLAFTFHSILENGEVHSSAGKTMQSIAEQALIGARGNSGIIFAQFFFGLSEAIGDAHLITTEAFSRAVEGAVRRSYEAISKPVEGTMLSVIRDWAEAVSSATKKRMSDFTHLFAHSQSIAAQSLKETPEKLKVLKDAHVVDAGAKGFVHFLTGALEFIKTGKAKPYKSTRMPEWEEPQKEQIGSEELVHRYCTEALIKGENIDTTRVKKDIRGLGDSLIVAGSSTRARVHIHTNKPADLFEKLRPYGLLLQQKADDMVRQQQAAYQRKYPIALVTDSVCDLPSEIIDRYQIHVVPLNLFLEGSQYLDKITISPDQFYRLLDQSRVYPTTSQPNPSVFRLLYSHLISHYDSVIAIHLSGQMSGTWNVSHQEAEKLPDSKITVIDSKHLSGSLGLLVLRAAEEIAAGRSHEEVVSVVENAVSRTDILVSVQTLKYMVRGGRVSPLKGLFAKLLNLKPIVSVDKEGRSILYGKAFSRRANMKKIVNMVKEHHRNGPLRYYAIGHAHAPDLAADCARRLTEELGKEPLYSVDISPIVGLNAGLGAVSVVTMKGE